LRVQGGALAFLLLLTAAAPAPAWQVRLTQLDRGGTVVGEPVSFSCIRSGCEQYVTLDVEGKPRQFLASVSFIPTGAYLGLQSMDRAVTKVVEFDKGFNGPIFMQMRPTSEYSQLLRFNLTGPALAESEQNGPQLMNNGQSMVFQRKVEPDLLLRVTMSPPTPADAKPAE
jgi:hypothetical protein